VRRLKRAWCQRRPARHAGGRGNFDKNRPIPSPSKPSLSYEELKKRRRTQAVEQEQSQTSAAPSPPSTPRVRSPPSPRRRIRDHYQYRHRPEGSPARQVAILPSSTSGSKPPRAASSTMSVHSEVSRSSGLASRTRPAIRPHAGVLFNCLLRQSATPSTPAARPATE